MKDTKNYCEDLKANELRLIDQLKLLEDTTTAETNKSSNIIETNKSPNLVETNKSSNLIETNKTPENSEDLILQSELLPEIPFVDPSAPFDIKQEPESTLKIVEVHTSYGVKEPSSDEWPEEPQIIQKRKSKPDKRRNRIRRPKGSPRVPRKRVFNNPDLDKEIENLPDTPDGKVNCSRCSKEIFKKYYRQHMERIHLNVKNFVCDTCGRTFYSHVAIKEHMNQHLNIKPIPCPFECGEFFANSTAKKKHVISNHVGYSEYICEICAKKFKEKHKLQVCWKF